MRKRNHLHRRSMLRSVTGSLLLPSLASIRETPTAAASQGTATAPIQRFVGILTKMQDTIRQRYQIDLEILLWPDHAIEQLQGSLEEANFKIIKVDEIIPELHSRKKRQPFIVHAKDSHPSALSNQLLAAELLRHLKINNPAFLSGNPNEQHQKTKSD